MPHRTVWSQLGRGQDVTPGLPRPLANLAAHACHGVYVLVCFVRFPVGHPLGAREIFEEAANGAASEEEKAQEIFSNKSVHVKDLQV